MDPIDQELAVLGAVLVEERVLRRVIKQHRKVRGFGLQVPHEQCYTLPRAALAKLLEPDDTKVALDELPERVLIASGDRDAIVEGKPAETSLLWRHLFHARVHQAFEELLEKKQLAIPAIRQRIHRVGQTEFDEIRSVLRQEDLLLPPTDDSSTYVEFVALYLELVHFAPHAVARTFPAVFDRKAIDETIALDVDPIALLAATRPPRAPVKPLVVAHEAPPVTEEPEVTTPLARPLAQKSSKKGNHARAAILYARAGDEHGASQELDTIIAQLARVLATEAKPEWTRALLPVAIFAARQRSTRFNPGARLLHDLQKAGMVSEHDVKAVDVFGWALSRGKQPLVRSLPATREVRIAKHVHAAAAKPVACELASPEDHAQLASALHGIAAAADEQLRATLRPQIEAALDAVDVHPHSLPERVGEKKLVDELLDRAVTLGRFTLGDLRDAISRSDLKLPDLALSDLGRGDQLLRADKLLSTSLDGVYRRGEVYMRALQKISSVLFGTPVGRFFTLYLMLPLLGSFAIVEGLQHMVGPVWKLFTGVMPVIATNVTLLAGAGFLFLLIHLALFRRAMSLLARGLWRIIRLVLFDAPVAILRMRAVQWFMASRFVGWIVKPAVPAAIVLLSTFDVIEPLRWFIVGGSFLVAAIVISSRFGRRAEEVTIDWLVRSSRQVTSHIVPGLVKWTLELFARMVESLDRFLYRVDEWLRFRTGQSWMKLVFKGVFGTLWFVITYIIRLYVNLFVEPTTNPVKHFPVVTVAAKLIIPFIPSMLEGITNVTSVFLGQQLAAGFAAFTVLVLPGLAGFLVWELKENWRLYRRTRSKTLRPLAIGHHGESMVRLLRPGFHSGTIPKLFTKLRRAAWRDDSAAAARATEGLHHVEEAVVTFVDRQLVSMLNESVAFRATDVASGHVEIGSNRVQIELRCPSVSPDAATIRFELQSGWLVASLRSLGWVAQLAPEQRDIFEIALAGFYKLSAIDLVREQLEHALVEGPGQTAPPYDVSDEGIVVWPGNAFDTEIVYTLRSSRLAPTVRGASYDGPLIDLARRHALYGREPLYWAKWSTTWQQIARSEAPSKVIVGPSLLPTAPSN
ncbi:MAG: hypothetical protein ACKV2T_07005 [Kofleriaceae bacterium]